jgi:uncharacterized surface protein with fasciclin (FAS1) repeats
MVQLSSASSATSVIGRRSLGRIAGGVVLAAPSLLMLRSSPAAAQARSALDLIKTAPAVSIFADILKTHDLEQEFSSPGSFGFFVPINAAIERVPALLVERFRGDKEYARKVVLNHITDFGTMVNGFGGSERTTETQSVRTKAGYTLTLVTGSGSPRIGGYPITYTNIQASNGYCHALDGVLMI